ncbi:MAG: tRNA uracil 4-sulfurtransferase ThiI [Candidatus Aenigmatarchaeota archaeon]
MKIDCILVRFGEIGLKGKNRPFFEMVLVRNIKQILKENGASFKKIYRIPGRFVIESEDQKSLEALKYVFGIVSFSPALKTDIDIEKIKAESLKVLIERNPKSFRVSARRLDKTVKTTSQKINEKVGEYLLGKTKIPVNLKSPELEIGIDFTKDKAFIFADEFNGLGGLPVGVSGKVLCFVSGGIDSPVAAWLGMKRGCEAILVHFLHGGIKPNKIIKLRDILKRYQPSLKLFIVPMEKVEKEIIRWSPSGLRIVILRRAFLKIAEKIMEQEGATAVITGDNIGQVASQTLHNIRVIDKAFSGTILRPLLGYDKVEIISLAQKIGTYPISIQPYEDCCSFMLPKHPETRASVDEVIKTEEMIDKGIFEEAFKRAEVVC